jgi:DNA-binding MarR family transcriptional regulator
VDDAEVRARRLRTAVQRSEPTTRLTDTLQLVEEMSAVTRSQEQIYATIEGLTGLRFGELQALTSVADGAEHARAVARATGQVDAAAEATLEVLERRGLLARHAHPAGPDGAAPSLVHLTPSGAVALQQAEALQVRLLDSALASLDAEEAGRLRAAVDRAVGIAARQRPVLAGLIAGAS